MFEQLLGVACGEQTNVIIMAVSANYDIFPRSILVQWLIFVFSDWVSLDESPQRSEFNGWVLGCAATASVNQHQAIRKEFRVNEWILAPFVVLTDDKGCVVESACREASSLRGRRHDACLEEVARLGSRAKLQTKPGATLTGVLYDCRL